jgi:hypothetical protein
MATSKQRKARRQQTRRRTPDTKRNPPDSVHSDDQWLAWGRDRGLDLTDRDQLLDGACVGLSVLCWRNTALEDVHAGVERAGRLQRRGQDAHDTAVAAAEDLARRAHRAALDVNLDVLDDVDPDERSRIGVLLQGRKRGFGIPDDIMMRLNISTARDVRAILDTALPDSVTVPGAELAYDRREVPAHVWMIVEALQNPDRELTVGGTRVAAGRVLGDSWDEYEHDVVDKISAHVRVCDLIGARRGLWHVALSGVTYASGWFPNPWWRRAVQALRGALLDNRLDEVFHRPDLMEEAPLPDEAFWEALATRPETLNGRQCRWTQKTRLGALLRQVQEADRQRLGPLHDGTRFTGTAAIF